MEGSKVIQAPDHWRRVELVANTVTAAVMANLRVLPRIAPTVARCGFAANSIQARSHNLCRTTLGYSALQHDLHG